MLYACIVLGIFVTIGRLVPAGDPTGAAEAGAAPAAGDGLPGRPAGRERL